MQLCSNCLSVVTELPTYVGDNKRWLPSEPSYILCCDCPNPIEVEDGELLNYEENWQTLDLDDLTEKEITILKYLTEQGRIAYANTEVLEGESADTVVYDKQLGLDLL